MPGCAYDAAGDPRDGLPRSVTLSVTARPTVSPMTTARPIQSLAGGRVRALVNEVPLSIGTPVNHPVRPASGTVSYLVASACAALDQARNLVAADRRGRSVRRHRLN